MSSNNKQQEKYFRVYNGITKSSWMMHENETLPYVRGKKSHFISTSYYTSEQVLEFKKTKSVAGFETKTNQIWFDFDSHDKPENSLRDAVILCTRLYKYFKIDEVAKYYSGSKGVHILVKFQQELNSQQVKKIAIKLGEGLETLDLKVYDNARILRAPNTIHEKTGLYKIPLLDDDLFLSLEKIKEMAKTPRELPYKFRETNLPQNLMVHQEPIADKKSIIIRDEKDPLRIKDIDFSSRPSGWKDYKWAIAQGRFEIGKRNHAQMVIASTCRALKYGREHTEAICLAADKIHCEITGDRPMVEGDLNKQILNVVFSANWNGGQYSSDNDPELKVYCDKYGFDLASQPAKIETIGLTDIHESFKYFISNIDNNTIKTGIKELDAALPIHIGNHVGIIGSASSGKTALALEILKHTSMNGVISVIASLDMHRNRLYEKILYKVSHDVYGKALSREELYKKIQNNEDTLLINEIKKQYGNVYFYDRSSPSVADIKNFIVLVENKTNQKVKLLMIDYFERIQSSLTDLTQSSYKIASELQDLLNDLNLAIITLVQPNKQALSGGPDTPILSYTAIKGSSFLYQSFRSIFSIWRPFFTPQTKELDHFLEMAILKNDLGELNTFKFNWDGKTGSIKTMNIKDEERYEEFTERKKEILNIDNNEDNNSGGPYGRFRRT